MCAKTAFCPINDFGVESKEILGHIFLGFIALSLSKSKPPIYVLLKRLPRMHTFILGDTGKLVWRNKIQVPHISALIIWSRQLFL